MNVTVEVSARHVHLSQADLETLFGKDYQLKELKKISQPGQFAAMEVVTVKTEKDYLEKVRIIGPVRSKTQVELSRTDARFLGINAPLSVSGNLKGSAGATLIGPAGEVELTEGVIVAQRPLHVATAEATALGLQDGQIVKIKLSGERGLVFEQVAVRVKDDFKLVCQIDTDEANAAGLTESKIEGELII